MMQETIRDGENMITSKIQSSPQKIITDDRSLLTCVIQEL